MEDNDEKVAQCAQANLPKMYHYYSTKEFWFFSMVCTKQHFFFVSLKFNSCDPNKPIFSDIIIYDSMKLDLWEHTRKTISFASCSIAVMYLLTLQ
jgi:hypothetical protein